jgi:hypothetical protein
MSRELKALKQSYMAAPASARRVSKPVERIDVSWGPVGARKALREKKLDISTQQFRARMEERTGRKIPDDCEICHIIARANGGADHEDNYIIERRRLNRTLREKHDYVFALLAGLEQTRKAVAVSIRLSKYKGPSAEDLLKKPW